MKTLGRAAVVAGALAIVGATVSVAHDPKQDIAQLQREVDALRAEKNQLQDQNLELARRFDADRRRMQILLETAQKQIARLEAGGAAAAPARPASPLEEKTIQLNCSGVAMAEVAEFVRDVTDLPVEAEGMSTWTLSLRTPRGITLREALDLIVLNAQDEDGEWAAVEWSAGDDGVIRLRPR